MEPQETPFLSSFSPLTPALNLGTTKRDIPLVPAGASGKRAITICTIFSDISCSPAEMKIFVPVKLYEPSALGSALHLSIPKSDPQ